MKKRTNWNRILIIFILILSACGSNEETGYGHLVNEKEAKIREVSYLPLEYSLYRENDTLSKLYFRLDPIHFLEKFDSSGVKNTMYRIHFEVRNNQLGSKNLVGISREELLKDSTVVLDSLVFSLPENKTVYYDLELTDVNKRSSKTYSAFWEREDQFIPEDFLLVAQSTNQVLTRPFIFNERINIKSRKVGERFKVKLYEDAQSSAQHMYEMESNPLYAKYEVKSEQFVSLKELEDMVNTLNEETFVKVESTSEEKQLSFNFTKLTVDDGPSIQPIVYLLSKDENVSFNTWVKFWSKASGNDEMKAEKLIREFNRRVDFANAIFSCHKLGWKTDRGMMYILHGPPDRIMDDVRSETWSYGFTSSVATSFVFVRNPSGLHKNDYVLERSIGYRDMESAAIQRWENGWIKFGIDGNQ